METVTTRARETTNHIMVQVRGYTGTFKRVDGWQDQVRTFVLTKGRKGDTYTLTHFRGCVGGRTYSHTI